ncbi:uncharacterized protein LOC144918869 isoform X1 [Branchiostoma floridae x Branchiostoma belcheri]
MKGLVFVVAAALACCVTTCSALKCRICSGEMYRMECLELAPLKNCSSDNCQTIKTTTTENGEFANETWDNFCGRGKGCTDAEKRGYCRDEEVNSTKTTTCHYCCMADGCVGGHASTADVSVVAMATAVLAVLLAARLHGDNDVI